MPEYRIRGNRLQRLKPGSIASYYEVAVLPRRVASMGIEAALSWANDRGRL